MATLRHMNPCPLGRIRQVAPTQIKLTSAVVDNQDNAPSPTQPSWALKKAVMPLSKFRWLTTSSPERAEGFQLVLEPMGFPPAQTYQRALTDAGIPATAFITHGIDTEYRRLKALGVIFRHAPKTMGPITAVLFEDTCGNLTNLVQPAAEPLHRAECHRQTGVCAHVER